MKTEPTTPPATPSRALRIALGQETTHWSRQFAYPNDPLPTPVHRRLLQCEPSPLQDHTAAVPTVLQREGHRAHHHHADAAPYPLPSTRARGGRPSGRTHSSRRPPSAPEYEAPKIRRARTGDAGKRGGPLNTKSPVPRSSDEQVVRLVDTRPATRPRVQALVRGSQATPDLAFTCTASRPSPAEPSPVLGGLQRATGFDPPHTTRPGERSSRYVGVGRAGSPLPHPGERRTPRAPALLVIARSPTGGTNGPRPHHVVRAGRPMPCGPGSDPARGRHLAS